MINSRPVDLDSILVMESRGGAVTPNQRVPRPLTFWQKVARFFGLSINQTYDIISTGHTDTSTKTVYFGNLTEQGVYHHGDDRTGAWSSGEFIEIDLDKLDPNVDTLTFTVLSFSGHDFHSLPFAEMKVFTGSPSRPVKGLVHHNLTDFKRGTRTVVLAQMKKVNGEWIITAKNEQSRDGSVSASTVLAKTI
jgi:tellurium resistance protein TerZ